jgi:hypothetical protein
LVEQTPLDRDLGVWRKINTHSVATNCNELDATQPSMRQDLDSRGNAQPLEDRSASRIQAITAHLLSRKSLSFEDERAVSRHGTKGRAGSSRGATPDDRDVEDHASVSSQASRRKSGCDLFAKYMSWSIPIFRVAGILVRIHVTFLLLLAWLGFSYYLQGGSAVAANRLFFILLLFACVLLHEFGHAIAAKAFGINTPDITLLPIGGVARLSECRKSRARN